MGGAGFLFLAYLKNAVFIDLRGGSFLTDRPDLIGLPLKSLILGPAQADYPKGISSSDTHDSKLTKNNIYKLWQHQ